MGKKVTKPGKWLGVLPDEATVLDAACIALGSRLGRLAELLPLAAHHAADDIEHVHQLRVMSRRSGAVLTTFAPVLPKRRLLRLLSRLRRVRKAADAARDLDVLHLRLVERGDAPAAFLAAIQRRRRKAQPGLLAVDKRFASGRKLIRAGQRLLARSPAERKSARRIASTPLAEWAPICAAEEADRLLRALPDRDDAGDWHRFRIAAKRLRYAIELLAGALPTAIRDDAYPELVSVQQRLGEMNDHQTALTRLSRWVEAGDSDIAEFASMLVREEEELAEASLSACRESRAGGGLKRLRELLIDPLEAARSRQ